MHCCSAAYGDASTVHHREPINILWIWLFQSVAADAMAVRCLRDLTASSIFNGGGFNPS